MKNYICIMSCAALLSACATSNRIDPETARVIIQEFHNAGCGGSFKMGSGVNIGQLGGTVRFDLDIDAECPVGDIPVKTLANVNDEDLDINSNPPLDSDPPFW
jgi:hypothetical protein